MELCFQSHWLFDNLAWHATVKSSIKIYIVIHNIDPSQTCVLELYINQNFSSKRQKICFYFLKTKTTVGITILDQLASPPCLKMGMEGEITSSVPCKCMNYVFTYPEDKEIIKEKEYCFAKITCFSTKFSGSDFTTSREIHYATIFGF